MLEIDQHLQRLAHDVVRARALHVHDEADAAGVVFRARVVQTLRAGGQLAPEAVTIVDMVGIILQIRRRHKGNTMI